MGLMESILSVIGRSERQKFLQHRYTETPGQSPFLVKKQRRPHGKPFQTRFKGKFKHSGKRRPRQNGVIAYHGTPALKNARSILRDGWMVGNGNAYGDGIYLSKDINVARKYASNKGVILKCRVTLRKCAYWNSDLSHQYQHWCYQRKVPADNSAKTAFLIQKGYKTLMTENKTIVILMPQYANQAAWKKKISYLKVLSIHLASNNQRIRV